MNKLLIAMRNVYDSPDTGVLGPLSIVFSILLLTLAVIMLVVYLFNVTPHAVLMGVFALFAFPTAAYYLKKHWPKE